MKVLQLCNKPPFPKVDGGCIAISNISLGLIEKGIQLKTLTVSTGKHPFLEDEIPADFKEKSKIEGVFLDTRVNVIDAFSALVTADSYNVNRFFSPDFDKRLVEILQADEYDIVHLESLFMTPYINSIRMNSSAKIVLRSHNLEHLIWERLANSTGNKAKKMYLKHLASKLKKYELKTINEVDGIATISNEDTDRFASFKCEKKMITIPFGINISDYPYEKRDTQVRNSLYHIGAMNWEPNKEAINWFLDEIWPMVNKEELSLNLAGRDFPSYLKELENDQLIIHGEVENARKFMQSHDIMIVPLLSGSGMRIKIIEAMALGKAVISTSIGVEGINAVHNEHIMIADTAKEFAKAIIDLSKDPDKVIRIGENARKMVENQYDNSKIIFNLVNFYKEI